MYAVRHRMYAVRRRRGRGLDPKTLMQEVGWVE
jgi:hypothetical protein